MDGLPAQANYPVIGVLTAVLSHVDTAASAPKTASPTLCFTLGAGPGGWGQKGRPPRSDTQASRLASQLCRAGVVRSENDKQKHPVTFQRDLIARNPVTADVTVIPKMGSHAGPRVLSSHSAMDRRPPIQLLHL